MISERDLIEEYGDVKPVGRGALFFQDRMRSYTYNYWLRTIGGRDLLVVSKDTIDDNLPFNIFSSVPNQLSADKPSVSTLPRGTSHFTHVFVVPSHYHSYLKGADNIDRDNLFLCIPIYRCEFSGGETVDEFRDMYLHYIPILEWSRPRCPKLYVYFDNPATGGGTDKAGVLLKQSVSLLEIEALNGVSDGFIEITNWQEKVVEIISPSLGSYKLIRDRKYEESLSKDELFIRIQKFLED